MTVVTPCIHDRQDPCMYVIDTFTLLYHLLSLPLSRAEGACLSDRRRHGLWLKGSPEPALGKAVGVRYHDHVIIWPSVRLCGIEARETSFSRATRVHSKEGYLFPLI